MHILGDFSSFLGSVWFACATLLLGYIAGHVAPISKFIKR